MKAGRKPRNTVRKSRNLSTALRSKASNDREAALLSEYGTAWVEVKDELMLLRELALYYERARRPISADQELELNQSRLFEKLTPQREVSGKLRGLTDDYVRKTINALWSGDVGFFERLKQAATALKLPDRRTALADGSRKSQMVDPIARWLVEVRHKLGIGPWDLKRLCDCYLDSHGAVREHDAAFSRKMRRTAELLGMKIRGKPGRPRKS